MPAPTITQVKARIEAIASSFPGMVTPAMNSIGTLTDAKLYALDVKPGPARRRWVTFGAREIVREYRLALFVKRVRATADERDSAMQAALTLAYDIIEQLPAHFANRQQLELNGGDGIVQWAEPMRDEGPQIVTYGNDTASLFAIIPYVLPVTTRE